MHLFVILSYQWFQVIYYFLSSNQYQSHVKYRIINFMYTDKNIMLTT